jgi:hypothetical protein
MRERIIRKVLNSLWSDAFAFGSIAVIVGLIVFEIWVQLTGP